MNHLSSNIDPMVYPLLFPYGDLGWIPGTLHNAKYRCSKYNKITCLQFYSYRLSVRFRFDPIFFCEKLFQQYVVDAYIRVESDRLTWYLNHQQDLRVEKYQGLMDHLNNESQSSNAKLGKNSYITIIFPRFAPCYAAKFSGCYGNCI